MNNRDMPNSELHHAAINGDGDGVKRLVDAGADINAVDNEGKSALLHALIKGRLDLAMLLLASGATANIQDNNKMTALMYALGTNNACKPELINQLILRGDTLTARDKHGRTLLMLAATTQNNIASIETLINLGIDVNAQDEKGVTALMYAAKRKATRDFDVTAISKTLINAKADVNTRDKRGRTALLHATHGPICHLLIDHGADINVVSSDNKNILHIAINGHFTDIALVKRLLRLGIKKELLEMKNVYGETPLHNILRIMLSDLTEPAERKEYEALLIALIDAGADPTNISGGISTLQLAAQHEDILMMLLNPHQKEMLNGMQDDETRIIQFGLSYNIESHNIVKLLQDIRTHQSEQAHRKKPVLPIFVYKRNLEKMTSNELPVFETPDLRDAIETGDVNTVKHLIRQGKEFHHTPQGFSDNWNDDDGLETAVNKGYTEIVSYLLARGASAEGLCRDAGITFLAKAAEAGNISMVEALLRHGASITHAINKAYEKLYKDSYLGCVSAIQYKYGDMPAAASINDDPQRIELEKKRDGFLDSYTRIVKTLLAYAQGCDFPKENTSFLSGKTGGLSFFGNLNVTNFILIGVSVGGVPLTPALLIKHGIKGADKATYTMNELTSNSDLDDQQWMTLTMRVNDAIKQDGELIDADGIINLVPLYVAAENGDITAVKARLAAGMDPSTGNSALVKAAELGHFDIVKLLVEAHKNHTETKAKQQVTKAKYLLETRSNSKVLLAHQGQLKEIPASFKSQQFLSIVTEYDHAQLMRLQHANDHFDKTAIEAIIQTAESRGLHAIIGFSTLTNTYKCAFYTDTCESSKTNAVIQEFIDDITSHSIPVIFTDTRNFRVIGALLTSQYENLDKKSKQKMAEALTMATKNNHALIANYLQSSLCIDQQDENGDSLLHNAVKQHDLIRVMQLIDNGADINLRNNDDESAIDIAAKCSSPLGTEADTYIKIIEYLLDRKAEVTLASLAQAIEADSPTSLALLLPTANKNDVVCYHYEDNTESHKPWYVDLMHAAIEHSNNLAMLTILKHHGADFSYCDEKYGITLLNQAIRSLPSFSDITRSISDVRRSVAGHEEHIDADMLNRAYDQIKNNNRDSIDKHLRLLHYLLDNAANPSLSDKVNGTPLYNLIANKYLSHIEHHRYEELLAKLVEKGANVNAMNQNNWTPLHAAAHTGDIPAVNFLIKHHAHLNTINGDGNTPLHLAVAGCLFKTMTLLIEAGADVTILNKKGLTPLKLLEESYKKKCDEISQHYENAKQQNRNEPRGLFYRSGSLDDQQKLHQHFCDKLKKLKYDYEELLRTLQVRREYALPHMGD